jgi:AcrR family transcriptional regulator
MPKVVDADERRAEITDAAARLIARAGVGAATLRDVAAEAGWTTGAITHYFDDKQELLLRTFEASLEHRLSLRVERESTAQTRPINALRSSLEGALPVDADSRRHWLVTVAFCSQAAGDPELARAQRDAYREFRDHVSRLVVEADLADAAYADALAERLIAAADGIAVQALFDPEHWSAKRQRDTLAAATAHVL